MHTTLEIAQTRMQRVALLFSYAFVAKKHSPTNFLKLEFDKIDQKNIPELVFLKLLMFVDSKTYRNCYSHFSSMHVMIINQ